MIHLDTSFLVDLLRETSRNRPDGAVRFIDGLDLLISTAAVLDDARLVTRNVKEFSRVPGLDVLAY